MAVFRSDGKKIYIDEDYCEFLIPMDWFDESKKFAVDQGNIIGMCGICNVALYPNGEVNPTIRTLNVPTWIYVNVYDTEIRRMMLPGFEKPESVKVLKYYKGNELMVSSIIADVSNAESFLKMIMAGKLPGSISYNDILSLWLINQNINDFVFDVPLLILEILLSTTYRDPENLEKKFASVYGKDSDASPYGYRTLNNRQICQYASTFTAMTFEDFDTMATTSINRARNKIEETESPLETIIKM